MRVCVDDDEEKKRLISRSTIIEAELFPRIKGVCGYQNNCDHYDLSQLLVPWMVMLTIMILVLMMHLLNAPHQFLMESAIYGVLDVMIKVLLEIVDAGDDDEGDEGDDDALGPLSGPNGIPLVHCY